MLRAEAALDLDPGGHEAALYIHIHVYVSDQALFSFFPWKPWPTVPLSCRHTSVVRDAAWSIRVSAQGCGQMPGDAHHLS